MLVAGSYFINIVTSPTLTELWNMIFRPLLPQQTWSMISIMDQPGGVRPFMA
jgi:hypothetical protein